MKMGCTDENKSGQAIRMCGILYGSTAICLQCFVLFLSMGLSVKHVLKMLGLYFIVAELGAGAISMHWVMVGRAIQHYISLCSSCFIWVKFMYASINWEVKLTITHWTERPGCRILCHVRSARTCQASLGFIGRGGIPIQPCEELEMYPLSF